jgi:chemotaxis protein CheX
MTLLTSEIITDLTQEIWSAFLSEHPEPLLPSDASGGDIVSAVDIAGGWNGTVCVACSTLAARHLTAALFGMTDDEITDLEIVDAVGELANVVSGNIKGLVPGPSVLSLPRVTEGAFEPPAGHLETVLEVRFSWMAEPVVVSVWTDEEL